MGFPTAPLVTIAFKDLAKPNAASRGVPLEGICFLPHPMTNKTDEQMCAVLEGNDPITNKPLMQEIIAALTAPLTAAKRRRARSPRMLIRQPTSIPPITCSAFTQITA